MNGLMLAQVSCTRNVEGKIKKLKEQYIVPGIYFSDAEKFVIELFEKETNVSDVSLDALKREDIVRILRQDVEVDYSWFRVTVNVDSDSKWNETHLVNAENAKEAYSVCNEELLSNYHSSQFDISKVVLTKIIDVFES